MLQDRKKILSSLEGKYFDVIVIGGGATGLGIAVDCINRGFSTLLLEQNDYAKGTSSRSTKILHGGVRYLAQGNISLVHEALREKMIIYKNAPHLSRAMEFIIPCNNILNQAFYGIGMFAYDALAGFPKKYLSKPVMSKSLDSKLPKIKLNHKKAGIIYSDGQFDDARMIISLVKTLENKGGHSLNYVKVDNFIKENDEITGVIASDKITGETITIKSDCVFNATGIYSDKLLAIDSGQQSDTVTLSQGIHLVVNKSVYDSNSAMLVPKNHRWKGIIFYSLVQ